MTKLLHWTLIIGLVCLGGCGNDEEESPGADSDSSGVASGGATDRSVTSWTEQQRQIGRDTYLRACANCHDQPTDGTPAIRDRDSWANRSPLWSAVLLEHAKNGYMDMDAKGGGEFSDREVEAAGEYMLTETFPELPRD